MTLFAFINYQSHLSTLTYLSCNLEDKQVKRLDPYSKMGGVAFCYAGGFAGNIGHDPHMLYTLSAVQVLALFDKLNVLDVDKVANCILIWFSLVSYEIGRPLFEILFIRNSSFAAI